MKINGSAEGIGHGTKGGIFIRFVRHRPDAFDG